MTVIGHQFITLTVYVCVEHGGRKVPPRANLSTTAETCYRLHAIPVAQPTTSKRSSYAARRTLVVALLKLCCCPFFSVNFKNPHL